MASGETTSLFGQSIFLRFFRESLTAGTENGFLQV